MAKCTLCGCETSGPGVYMHGSDCPIMEIKSLVRPENVTDYLKINIHGIVMVNNPESGQNWLLDEYTGCWYLCQWDYSSDQSVSLSASALTAFCDERISRALPKARP